MTVQIGDETAGAASGGSSAALASGWILLPNGGLNIGDGWAAVSPAGFQGAGVQFEGDQCGVLRGTEGGPGFQPFGILRRDFAPSIDLTTHGKLRYRYRILVGGYTFQQITTYYSSALSRASSKSFANIGYTNGAWVLSPEFDRPTNAVLPGGPVDWAAVERIDLTFENITGSPFGPPENFYVDALEGELRIGGQVISVDVVI